MRINTAQLAISPASWTGTVFLIEINTSDISGILLAQQVSWMDGWMDLLMCTGVATASSRFPVKKKAVLSGIA